MSGGHGADHGGGHDTGHGKKKANLGAWEKPEETFDKRKSDRESLLSVIDAIDSGFEAKVGEIVKKHSGKGVADYTILQDGHKNYKQEAVDAVRAEVDKHYNVENPLFPYKDFLKDMKSSNNFYLAPLATHLFFKHKSDIVNSVTSRQFQQKLKTMQETNKQRVSHDTLEQAVADIDTDEKKEHVSNYLVTKSGADAKKIKHKEVLHRAAPDLARGYVLNGQVAADQLYDIANLTHQSQRQY